MLNNLDHVVGGGPVAWLVFCGVFLSVPFSSAIILLRKREWLLYSCYRVAVCVLCLFLVVPWVGQLSVVVAFPGLTHFLCITVDLPPHNVHNSHYIVHD